MVGIDSGGTTQYWKFNGKTYYSYASWLKAKADYAAYLTKLQQAAAAKQATSSTTYKPPAAVAPAPLVKPPYVAPVYRKPSVAPKTSPAYAAALAAQQRQRQAAWEAQQRALMARRAAELKRRREAEARARALAALRKRQAELKRQLAELARRKAEAAKRQQVLVRQQLARIKAQEQEALARAARSRAYENLKVTNTRKLSYLQSQQGQRLDAVRSPLRTLSGRQELYAARQQEKRKPIVLDARRPFGRVTMLDQASAQDKQNAKIVGKARTTGNWDSVIDMLDSQSKASGGRFHDEALYQALQREYVQPIMEIDRLGQELFVEYDAALEAGDTDRLAELSEEARPLMEKHVEYFGDGLKPGKASRVMQVLTDIARRRDRVWLATIGANGEPLGGYSEQAIDALEERGRKKGEVTRGVHVRALDGEERGQKRNVVGPLSYYRQIRDQNGRPVNIVEFGVDAYIARERAREQVRMRDAYSATAMGERAMITSGMEQVLGRNGNMVWRRKDVGDALEAAADALGISDKQFMGRFDNVMQEDDPAVQEVELRRLLNDIQVSVKREWEREHGANYLGRDMKGGTAFRAERDRFIKSRMDNVVFGLTGVKGGGINYDGAWVPPIGQILPALSDPVNDVVNRFRDWAEPGVSRHGEFYTHRADDGWWNSTFAYRTSVNGVADPKDPDYDPVVAREYALWIKNRDHPDGDVRSAANRRWRQITLTGNVSFVADVVVDPLNALGLLTKPFQAARLVARTAPMVGKFTGMPIGPQSALGRFAQYMTPQVQSRKVAGWQNMINYHHVRMDQVRVNTARELGVPIRQILNYSDGEWEEFARVRNMGEEAVGETQIGKDLFATAGVNRTQIMTVLQTRLPEIMRRYGVSFVDPAERARQLQHLEEARKWSDSQIETVDELQRKMVEHADQIRALRTVRNRKGNRLSAEHIADLDQRIKRLTNERNIARRRLEDLEQENSARAWRHRRNTGMSDELSDELMTLDAQEAALTGGNPMAARKLQDRIAVVRNSWVTEANPAKRAKFAATLADLEKRLRDLPGVTDRVKWHRVQKARRDWEMRVQRERRGAGIYAHFNNPGRIKQMRGELRPEVNARAPSAWGRVRPNSPFGRGLYLSGDDSVWSRIPEFVKKTTRSGGKSKKAAAGGVMKSNKGGRVAPATTSETTPRPRKLKKGFFQIDPGVRERIKEIRNITQLRAAFKEVGWTYGGRLEELEALANALRDLGYTGIEIAGLTNKKAPAAWQKLQRELGGDMLVLFDPDNAGTWIDDVAEAPIDLTDARSLVDEAEQGIEDLTRAKQRAEAEYKAVQKAPVRDDVVSSATLKIGVKEVGERPPIGGKILRYITRELKPLRGSRKNAKDTTSTRLAVKVEVETTYDAIVRDLSETTKAYRALLELAERDMDIVGRADELSKIPGPSGEGALRAANIRLKKTLKEMADYEDRVVYEVQWPGSSAPRDVEYPGETNFEFGKRVARAKLLGQEVPTEKFGPRPLKPVERKGLITARMEALGSYHRAVGGDPFAPSFVDTTLTKIAEDRKWLKGLARDLEFRIQNAKSEAQAELFMRELAQIEEAQKGLEIEFNFVDKGKTMARKYAVERLDRVKPAVRPQRLAHLARDEQGRLFGASDDLNRRLRRIEDVLEDSKRLSPVVRGHLEKVVAQIRDIPANRVEIRPGVSKTQRMVVKLENAVGQGELSLYDAYVITNMMMRDVHLRSVWMPTHRALGRRIARLAEDAGIQELKLRDISDFIATRHIALGLPTDSVYTLYKQLDSLTAAELERVRGFRAEGQVPLASGKKKKPSKFRTLNANDTDPMVIGAKLKIARETGVDMFVYDEMRSVFGDIMLRENRSAELLEQAEALAKTRGTTVDEEFLKLRELRAEEEAVRAFEEFATRPEFQGMPMERVLRVFEERNILKDLGGTPPLRVNQLQHDLLQAAWKEITGFDHADEAARAKWLQRQFGDITDPEWLKEVEDAKRLLAQNDADIKWNIAHAKEIDAVNARRRARVDAGDITKQNIAVAKLNVRNLLSPRRRAELQAVVDSPRRTIGGVAGVGSAPPLHRRDLMREWLVKEGRWDPQTGEDIRLGRRPWSVDEERAFYEDNFGMAPIWTDDDWLAIVLRDQRAYQRAFREVGFSDEAFEALADGQIVDPVTGELTLTGEMLRGKDLVESMVWGKKGFKAQRSLAELREWAIGRYGDRVAINGKFHTMPWLMKLDQDEYFPWLRRALGMEARAEFRELLDRTKDKMDPYLKSQYFDDAGDLRALGLDIDPTLLGAKNADEGEQLLHSLREALYEGMEQRVRRMQKKGFAVEGEWMGQELLAFSYDVMTSLMVNQRWRGVFRGRTLLQQLLHMAGWQRAIVSFNPAFGVMNLMESYGYKRGLLAAIHNNFVPLGVSGQKYDWLIPNLDIIDKNASRLFGLEGKAKFLARTRDGGLSAGVRLRGTVDDLANWGAHASQAGENKLRLDFARVMAGQAYESALHQGVGKGAATVMAQMHAKRMLDVYFASIGDNALMMAFNQLIPFFSYRLKQMTLAVTMSVKHPWIPLLLGKIQDAIIDANRALWIKEHGSDEGFNPNDIRSHSLWIEIDGQFYGLDLWDVSDWTRAMRALVRRGTTGGTIQDYVGDFIRVPHPLQLGIYAALTGGVTPWGKPGDWREVFWFVDLAQWMMGNDYDNPRWKRDALQMGTQMFFFSAFNKITETDQAVMTFYAMKEAGDSKAAQEYFDKHPEIQAYFDSTKPFRPPRWDPYNGRSASWYANLDDATRDEYNTLYDEFKSLVKSLDEEIFKFASAPWSDDYREARRRRNLVLTQWHVENPLLSRLWALEVPYKEFVRLQDDWLVDGQVDTWFHILDQKPQKGDFKTDLEYAQALVKFNEMKSAWLDGHPAVTTRLYDSNNALVKAWHDQELHWSEILDFQARLNLRIIEEEEKGADTDEDLVDVLYQVKNDASQLLDAESYAFVNENVVAGSNRAARAAGARIAAAAWGSDMERLKSAIQIPGFADYRYGNASPEERQEMRLDARYYDRLGALAEQMKAHRDEPFSDKNDWWGQLKARGLLDRYLKENPHKKDDYEYVVAIGNIVTNYGQNFWSGLMEPGNQWLLNEYLKRNPDKRGQYQFMRGLDEIWKRIGNDYGRFYSELAKNPWLEAEYFRRNPDKAGKGAKSAYALAMGRLVNSATSGADFYAKLNSNPWLRDEYFRRHPEKLAKMQANQAYINALGPWVKALKRNDFVAANAAWGAMPAWARERYLSTHPESGMHNRGGRRSSSAVEYKGKWFKSAASRDKYIKWIEGGSKGSAPPADGSAPRFRSEESRARFVQGQQYYAGIGGWVELLKKKDYVGAKKYFDALPVWMKEKYWAKHPDQRAKMELDSTMLADGAQYFLASGSDKDKILARNPQLMRWLQEHGGEEASHRGLIIAMYRAIPSKEPWLKRTFRERFPEIFSPEAAAERTFKKIALKLAENPEMLPYYEKAVKLQYEIYAEQLKRQGAVPAPWTMERAKRLKKRKKRRVAGASSHATMHYAI